RVWRIARPRPDAAALATAAQWIARAERPLIIAGGGAIYADATAALARLAERTGVPVAETQAGKGALRFDHAQAVGAMGVTGTSAANILAREADLVIGIGTRYSDFTSASKTAFQNSALRFINVNVAELDAYKHAGLPLVGDARECIHAIRLSLGKQSSVGEYRVASDYARRVARLRDEWFH